MANSLWRFLTTDIKDLAPTKMLDGTTSAAKVVFDLAAALKPEKGKQQVEELAPLVGHLDSLLDVLNSPLGEVAEKSIPFVPLATGLLRFYLEKSKVALTLESCIALVAQAAYLESFKFFLEADQSLLKRFDGKSGSDAISQKIKSLADIEVNREMAQRVMTQFPTSKLVQDFGKVLQARLEEAGLLQEEAQRLTERVAWHAPHYLNEIWAKSEEAVKHLGQTTLPEWRTEKARYQSLEDYLREVIQPGPEESIFGESSLTFRNLYVPLEVERMDDGQGRLCDIGEWVEKHLLDSTKNEVLFIQGEAGRGKSVFCRMFADWVRASLYPAYTPILIRLREIRHLEHNLSGTLKNILETQQFVVADNSWLTRKDMRFLFLLDGFDELFFEGRGDGEKLKEFWQQVEQFQLGSHHRFIITGRPLALQGMERLISQAKQLQRAELQPMSDSLIEQWFRQWDKQFEKEAKAFQKFLEACPQDVGNILAREPLLLYLLGRMHREERLKTTMFKGTEGIQAKVVIYDKVVRWMIDEQWKNKNSRQVRLKSEDLRDALREVAVCVVQSGNEVAKVSFLEARLFAKNTQIYNRLREVRKRMRISKKRLLKNVLATFYIKPAAGDPKGSVEFVHNSFGEFLFAERLAYTLKDWSTSVPDEIMHRDIYDLLGYGGLSKEVMDYVMAMLKPTQATSERLKDTKLEDTQWSQLSERLERFSQRWWEGEFIDEVQLPQGKMLSLREQIPEALGIRQVDAYAGLNTLILLLELHRYGQSQDALKKTLAFFPCGPEKAKYKSSRLNRVIGYSECIEARAFGRFVGPFLNDVNLSTADFSSANLIGANLRGSDLSHADLSRTDLRIADLSGAILSQANLCRANLSYANLSYANLSGADLIDVDFSDADLSGAHVNLGQLDHVILCRTTLPDGTVRNRDCE